MAASRLRRASTTASVVVTVILGAWAAPRFGNYSLWLAEPFLLAIVVLSFRRPSAPTSPLPSH